MSYLNILLILLFVVGILFVSFGKKIVGEKYVKFFVLGISIFYAGLFVFYKMPVAFYKLAAEGGIFPYQDIGAKDYTISIAFMLDICGMFSFLTAIFYPILHFKHKGDASKSFMRFIAPIGFIGGLLTVSATVSSFNIVQLQLTNNVALNQFANLFIYGTVGFYLEPAFYFEHFFMAIACFYVLTKSYRYTLKSYLSTYLTIGLYMVYVLAMRGITGVNQGVSATGIYDFFPSPNLEFHRPPAYGVIQEIFNVGSYEVVVFLSWTIFILAANMVIGSKNVLYTIKYQKDSKLSQFLNSLKKKKWLEDER